MTKQDKSQEHEYSTTQTTINKRIEGLLLVRSDLESNGEVRFLLVASPKLDFNRRR